MRPIPAFEYPKSLEADYRRARRLEWISVAYIVSSSALLYLTMGSSQAMRTSFLDDAISLVPGVSFLITTRVARRRPGPTYPYGHHGAVSIGFLTAAIALVAMGGFLLVEGFLKLVAGERTTIGGVTVFGRTFWAGWLMFAALSYTSIPSVLLGRAKMKLAPRLHDKVLYADAKMMKADWMGELATAAGVLGVGLGLWWADPVAGIVVSLDILHDGWATLRSAVGDLIERRPLELDRSGPDPLPDRIREFLERLDWIAAAQVRLREQGHVFLGEAFIVPRTTEGLAERVERAAEGARRLDWRLQELVVMPVTRLDGAESP